MPSGTAAAAVMAVSDIIWTFDTWKERTKNVTLPFDPEATPSQTGLTLRELEAVRALAHRIHSIHDDFRKRVNIFKKEDDNDKAGKEAWVKWYDKVHPGWRMTEDMEDLLDAYERHPRLMVGDGGVGSVSGHQRRGESLRG
jgi:hypothetical protein